MSCKLVSCSIWHECDKILGDGISPICATEQTGGTQPTSTNAGMAAEAAQIAAEMTQYLSSGEMITLSDCVTRIAAWSRQLRHA